MRQNREHSTQKGGGHARSTGKSTDELKKVTPCNRCGAIGHWEEDCTQLVEKQKEEILLCKRAKDKVVVSGEENLMENDEESSNYPDCGGL